MIKLKQICTPRSFLISHIQGRVLWEQINKTALGDVRCQGYSKVLCASLYFNLKRSLRDVRPLLDKRAIRI